MPETLAEQAQAVRAEFGRLWERVNAVTDRPGTQPPRDERNALLRELAELARLPFDVAESLGGGPDEALSAAAANARASLLRLTGQEPDRPTTCRNSLDEPVRLPRL